ncbi:MAG: hypothetical protein KJZ85_19670, partial [Rhodobacteraceae bacterium]|nr:hypothetical protein [Paracoccaceae bacterium]
GAAGSSGNDGAAGDPDAGGAADDPLAAARAARRFALARAAAQGMVEAAPPALLPPPPPAPEAPPGPPPAPVNAAPAVPIMVETGLDRAARGTPRIALTPGGGDCPEDAAFDVPAWGGEGGPADAIAARRAALIGEFDRPDPAAVLALARLYVHLGFGAEAGAALAAFGAGGEEVERLAALALLVDGAAAAPAAPFAGLEACDGAVALWAVLAAPRLETGAPVAAGAVVRGFSALPLHLRRLLGRPLADRFLDTGDAETARALRDAAERAGGPGGDAIDLVSARIALARGRVDEAEAALAALATRPGPEAAEALALLVETLLSRGAEVAPGHVTAAEAFAYELSGTATGTRLASAHARALAARGEHDAAFAALARMPPGPATAALADALHATLAAGASEASFLRHAFAALPGSAPAAPHRPSGAPARRALAGRLVGLGFGPEAQALLGPAAALPPGDRPLWAAAALAAGDPRAAVAALAGDGSAAAAAIRGDALSRLGDHRGAAAAFAGSDPDRAAAAGWRAAAGGGAASPPAVASALAALAPAVDGATPAEGGGDAPLAAARALLADSAARRTAAAVLLAAYPPP